MKIGWPFRSKVPFGQRFKAVCNWRGLRHAVRVGLELRSYSIAWWCFWTVPEDYD